MRPSYTADVPLVKALQVLEKPNTFSLGIHIRAGDAASQSEEGLDPALDPSDEFCQGLDPKEGYMQRLGCMIKLGKQHLKAENRVLVVFSDSRCVKKHIMDFIKDSTTFTEVWSQELSGTVNIDTTITQGDTMHAWKQSMRDWLLMQKVDTFAVSTTYEW